MNYVLLDEQGAILKYPASPAEVKKSNPNTSFPKGADDAFWASFNMYPVLGTAQPVHDEFSQRVRESSPILQDGTWLQTWVVEDRPESELVERCDYREFWDALIASPVYQVVRRQASTSLPVNTCCTEFIAAMTDAKTGHPNRDALQMCIWLLIAALDLTTAEVNELGRLLSIGDLNRLYTLTQPV